jgi:3-hydroxymyristoyl/3-hydroxydecanoyl-(acyl carrier protein) dehydratase
MSADLRWAIDGPRLAAGQPSGGHRRPDVAGDARPAAVGVGEIRFRGDITPAVKRGRYEVNMRLVRRGKLPLGIANGSAFADDACVYLARDMKVGLIASAV